jgi:hypothetical protein
LRLRAGTLDEPVAARVAAHYCVADKAPWWTIAGTLPQYAGSRAASPERGSAGAEQAPASGQSPVAGG